MKRTVALLLCAAAVFCLSSCFFKRELTLEEHMEKNEVLYDLIEKTGDEDEMTMDFSARGNDLVLTVRIKDKVNNVEAVSEAMSKAITAQADVYLEMLEEVKEEVPSAESMIVEIYDENNVLIVYEQFK